jgi:penicillin-binding protein 2
MLIRSAPGSQPVMPQIQRRVRWMLFVVCGAFLVLIGRLWQLQVMRGEQYHAGVLKNVVNTRYLPAVRGKILDREGRPLVDNRAAFNIYVTPSLFDVPHEARLAELLDLTDGERATVRERVADARERDSHRAVVVLEDQGRDRAALVSQARMELPGVRVVDEPYRRYAYGTLAAHVLGYMNHLTPSELAEYGTQGYDSSEFIGRNGLERQWEHYLRGKKGIERYVVDATRERVDDEESQALIEGPKFEPPVPGHNIVTTLDLDLQRLAERAVRWHSAAAVVVVEADTGRLLALVSKPAFDPNVMTGHLTPEVEQALLADPRKPFIDKTLRQHYPPGSTFKPVTMIAAVDSGLVDPEEERVCRGWHQRGRRTFRCPGGASHGKIDMVHAIKHSCNVYVWELSEIVTLDRMADVARDLGFGAPTGLGLNGDVPGRMPTREWYDGRRDGFKIGYTLNSATGQGDVEVTVMQLALAYAAIANGGELYVPQIVQRIETASGKVVAEYAPTLRRHIKASERVLEILRQGMRAVVNEEGGTAHKANSDIVEYAGKTGTAQVLGRRRRREADEQPMQGWDPRRDHAWFAGYAPANDPEIAVVVLIEHGGHGGKAAAPVAREIFEGYFGGDAAASSEGEGAP